MMNPLGVGNKAYAHFEKAESALEEGDLDRAVAELSKAIDLEPGFGEAYVVLSVAYSQAGRFEEACAALRNAVDHPHHIPVHMILDLLIDALAKNESYVEALEAIERREAMSPPPHNLAGTKGHCLEMLERYPEALTTFRQAVEEEPEESLYWCSLGEMAAECDDKAAVVEAREVLEWMASDRAAHLGQAVELCRGMGLVVPVSNSDENEEARDDADVTPQAVEPLTGGIPEVSLAEVTKAFEQADSPLDAMEAQRGWLLSKLDECKVLPQPLRAVYRKNGRLPLRFVVEMFSPVVTREQASGMATLLEQLGEMGVPPGFAAWQACLLDVAGRDDEAFAAYQSAVVENRNEPWLWLRLIRMAARGGDADTAIDAFSELEELSEFAADELEGTRELLQQMEEEAD